MRWAAIDQNRIRRLTEDIAFFTSGLYDILNSEDKKHVTAMLNA